MQWHMLSNIKSHALSTIHDTDMPHQSVMDFSSLAYVLDAHMSGSQSSQSSYKIALGQP